jgi:TetR/AcrR family transcriptional regulator, transcriptional repressor for nem operon
MRESSVASRETESDTASEILDVAERLAQTRGFNGFSYADVSSELSLTNAALHYHFPSKAELGQRLITRYTDRFRSALVAIEEADAPSSEKLGTYCELYRGTLRNERMCLCGMFAAEYNTLGDSMRDALTAFFDLNQAWLTTLLETGRKKGDLRFTEPAEQAAKAIVSALEGAMLIASPLHDLAVLDAVIDRIITDFTRGTSRPRRARSPGGSR